MTDYGSGAWGGPTTSTIQDAGWAYQTLTVGFLGNSIAFRSAPRLRTRFGAMAGVTSFAVRAHAGQNWAGSNDWLDSVTYMPDVMICELGTNDVFNPYAVPAQLQRTKDIIGPNVELFCVNTYVARPAYMADDLRNSGLVNDFIHEAMPKDHIINWVSELTAARGRGRALSYYLEDGVHPWTTVADGHADGSDFFAAVVANAVAPFMV